MQNIVESLAEPVANRWKELQKEYTAVGEFYVASPLSSTPLPIYKHIVSNSADFSGWDKTQFILMDEQVDGDKPPYKYVPADDTASYEKFARDNFLDPLREKTHITIPVIKPDPEDFKSFSSRIKEHGGIDLLILALGINGNYANVMSGTPVDIGWHIAHLSPEFRHVHTQTGSESYAGAKFREYGMSLGPQQVLNAKHVVVIISGKNKRELAQNLFSYNDFDPLFPLSIIHHPLLNARVEIFITQDAAR